MAASSERPLVDFFCQLLSDNEVIVFFRTYENKKTENNETRYKRYSGNFSKREKKTEMEDNTPVER